MRIKLTERAVAAITLQPGEVQSVVWDTELTGFGVVVGKQTRTFTVSARVAGRKVRTKIGIAGKVRDDGHQWNVQLARQRARELLGKMASGVDPNSERVRASGGPTLRDALDFHIGKMEAGENRRRKVCSARSVKTLRGGIELHFAEWLDRPLVRLTADVLDDTLRDLLKHAERIAGSSPKNPPGRALANRLLANMSAIWRSYHRRYGLPVANPCERLLPGALAPRDARVGNDELPAWHKKVEAMRNERENKTRRVRGDLQLVALFTGVRTDGLRHLQWDDIDFDARLIHVARAKGDRPYTIPMVDTVRKILKRRETERRTFAVFEKCVSWVFPSPESAEGCVAEVKERRDVRDEDGDVVGRESHLPGVHVARRTFNSIAMEIGIPKESREALMNHEGRGVNVKHYGRPQNWDYLRSCANQIEAALWKRIRGAPRRQKRLAASRGA